jgi:hypothetical protein
MSTFRPLSLLRFALLGDAIATGTTGLLMALGAGFLTSLLGLPESLLRWAGLLLLPYAAAIAYLGTRERLSRGSVWTVIASNAVWAAASVLLLLSGWVHPSGLGTAFVIFQAVAVAAFAEAQYLGLRRATAPVMAAA